MVFAWFPAKTHAKILWTFVRGGRGIEIPGYHIFTRSAGFGLSWSYAAGIPNLIHRGEGGRLCCFVVEGRAVMVGGWNLFA
mgnify:CR=1 FL=1